MDWRRTKPSPTRRGPRHGAGRGWGGVGIVLLVYKRSCLLADICHEYEGDQKVTLMEDHGERRDWIVWLRITRQGTFGLRENWQYVSHLSDSDLCCVETL